MKLGFAFLYEFDLLVGCARHDARLYDGSLTEWSARPDLPLVTG